MMPEVRHLRLAVLAVALLALAGCSTRRNTAATRNYQAFITRYNIYFNGNEHFLTTLGEMEKNYEDEYSRLVPIHPVEAYADKHLPQPSGSFTRSIEKAQKAIQLRSIKRKPKRRAGLGKDPEYREWLKREEYNPFIHNAWMLMARSQYFNGDFTAAASTFAYIAKHFRWLPATVTEARIWEARCYCADGRLVEAGSILSRIKEKDLTDNDLRGLYGFAMADLAIHEDRYSDAIPHLLTAIASANGAQKTRLRFLLGQLYALSGDKTAAYDTFASIAGNVNIPYRTKFNARIKQSEVVSNADVSKEIRNLERLTRYERNNQYLDQLHYAIGNLYMAKGDTVRAVKSYVTGAEKSERNGLDKALLQLRLGDIYFTRHLYAEAQPCYAEALPLLPENYPGYATIKRRSDVLDELAVYAQNIHLQDSLLHLADLSPEERMEVAMRLAREQQERERQEARQQETDQRMAEAEDLRASNQNLSTASAPTTFSLGSDQSWYFYNRTAVEAGKAEFRKRWGSRKLEDDWRRRNKLSYGTGTTQPETTDEGDGPAAPSAGTLDPKPQGEEPPSPTDPQFYLAQIPDTPEDREAAHESIQESLYNMGLILKDRLEDYTDAAVAFNRLLRDYPDNVYRLDTYYNLYLMAMLSDDTSQAETWRRLIVDEFPDSPYGQAMQNDDYFANLRAMHSNQEAMYSQTYADYLADRNTEVHRSVAEVSERYPMSEIMPKFLFVDALAYVTEGNREMFDSTLRVIVARYPEADVSPLAAAYLNQLSTGRQLHSPSENLRGMVWTTRLSESSAETNGADSTGTVRDFGFTFDSALPHVVILAYPTDSVSANALLFDVASFNFTAFDLMDFDLEQLDFGQLGLLLVKGFADRSEAAAYLRRLESSVGLSPGVKPILMADDDFTRLVKNGGSLDDYLRAAETDQSDRVHRSVLPAAHYPSAAEMYDNP